MEYFDRRIVSVFPWDTFLVNMTGCFIAGLVVATLVNGHETPAWLRIGLLVGFLGAYTTFSTFGQDLYDLTAGREYVEAVANAVGSVTLGLLAVLLGTLAGRAL
jgi:CrcB protein